MDQNKDHYDDGDDNDNDDDAALSNSIGEAHMDNLMHSQLRFHSMAMSQTCTLVGVAHFRK